MRFRPSFAVILLLAINPGCASVGVRAGAYSETAEVYPATAVDAGILFYVVRKPFVSSADPAFHSDAQEGLVYLFLPVAIVDLPLAAVVDTLFLPQDLQKSAEKRSDSAQ